MNRKALLKGVLLFTGMLFIQSCSDDFNTLGSKIIGNEGFIMDKYTTKELIAYSQVTGDGNEPAAVETGNLPYNTLGAYNDPFFGKTEASFVTQVLLPKFNHLNSIGANPKIDSVYIYIPYGVQGVKEKEETLPLKNNFGEGKFDLKIYQNGYYLSDSNPEAGAFKIYSDEGYKIENFIKETVLNDSNNTSQNTAFTFDNSEREDKFYKLNNSGNIETNSSGKVVFVESKTPAMWVDLNKQYFEDLFFSEENKDKFSNANVFKDFFRGLYFKAEFAADSEGSLGLLNFGKGKLVIIYSQDSATAGEAREKKIVEFPLSSDLTTDNPLISPAITANFFSSDFSAKYLQGLAAADKVNGDEKLYLKGGNGSFSVIEPFKKDSEELKTLRENKWLINDARLTIYVDKISLANDKQIEPDRIYLYDLDNNTVILDYITDNAPRRGAYSKSVYGGILEKESSNNNKGIRYRIKVADYINNIVNKDGENLRLGLVVSYDVNNVTSKSLKEESNTISKIPTSSVMFPFGTVLYGNNTKDEDKKMKLDIFYTNPKNK